jgi:cell division protein FtsZ
MIEVTNDIEQLRPRICVIGVGGAGGNAIASMMRSDVQGVEFIAANTDAQALRASSAPQILQLGRTTTEGLGAGGHPAIGKVAAEDSLAEINLMLDGAHMCFIAAGMGGGTGSGAAPVIAKAARDKGILTVGVVTKPFDFEGKRRARTAALGLDDLRENVDTLIVIPNQNLFRIATPEMTFKAAFDLADEVLQQGVRGITDLMTMPGLINLDFADIRTIMANMGPAMMGVGEATGDDRAIRAAEQAISNPLLDEALRGARGLIISITGGDDVRLWEIDEIASHVRDLIDPDADIIWGSAFDQSMAEKIRVTVVATGIDSPGAGTANYPAATVALARTMSSFPIAAPLLVRQCAVELRGTPPASRLTAASAGAPSNEELLLMAERRLVLTPPEGATNFPTIDPFAIQQDRRPSPALRRAAPDRGPSLFQRMTMVTRGPAIAARGAYDAPSASLPYLNRRTVAQPVEQAA